MHQLLRLAWRNIGRNPRRTLLTLLVVSVGTASMMITDAFILGTEKNMINLSTGLFAGQAQLHHPQFKELQEAEYTIPKHKSVIDILNNSPKISHFTERVVMTGMVSSSRDSAMVQVYGVNFSTEPHITKLKRAISWGLYPTADMERPIVLGYKLAKQLQVQEGDKVVITTSEARTGELVQELFRVAGRTNFNSRPMDAGIGFIPISMAQKILKLGDEVHEIAIEFQQIESAVDPYLPLWEQFKHLGVLAEGWDKVFPSLNAMMEMSRYSLFITAIILFALISLSILNTMFMSIYERLFEFGVIKAVGTRSWHVGLMIILECTGIGILGIILGGIGGTALIIWLGINGISFSEFELNGMSMVDPIKTVARWEQFTLIPIAVLFMCILASLYPAFHASQITPARAMRKTQ